MKSLEALMRMAPLLLFGGRRWLRWFDVELCFVYFELDLLHHHSCFR
jgi:hypothetical protein